VQLLIRAEEPRDWVAVHAVNVAAFGRPAEANLVDALRAQAQLYVSLIAEVDDTIVGHIMFSPVSLSGHEGLGIMGLAPLAVAPEHQRKGVGVALVRTGLDQCTGLGFGAVVVLGHPDYYHRFGFSSSARFGIGCNYQVAEDAFMVVELQAGFLRGASGTIKYHTAFSDV
jgi:putative acetyltransferase